jgi:hypothetical protein
MVDMGDDGDIAQIHVSVMGASSGWARGDIAGWRCASQAVHRAVEVRSRRGDLTRERAAAQIGSGCANFMRLFRRRPLVTLPLH